MESVFRYIEEVNNGRFSKFIKIPSFSEYFQKLDVKSKAEKKHLKFGREEFRTFKH